MQRVSNSQMTSSQKTMDRRRFLGGSLALALAASCDAPPAAAADRLLTLSFGWVPNAEYADIFVGMENQHFAHAGLTIKYLGGGPNAPVSLVTLAAGQADIAGTSWLQLLDAQAHGNDFVIIASMVPVTAEGLISLPKRPVVKPADLPGARLLLQGPAERAVMDAVFKLNHLPPERRYVPAGYSPDALLA